MTDLENRISHYLSIAAPHTKARRGHQLLAEALAALRASHSARPEAAEKAGYANGYATAIETAAQHIELCPTLSAALERHNRGLAKSIRALGEPLPQKEGR